MIEAPLIRIEPLAGPPIDPAAYDVVCVTSPNSPRLLLDRVGGRRALAGGRSTSRPSGPGTAAALREVGIVADVVAERFVAEGMRRGARAASRASASWWRAPRRPATPCPTACARAAPRSTSCRSTARSRERPRGVDARRGRLGDVHVVVDGARLRRGVSRTPTWRRVRGVSIGPVTSATMRELGVGLVAEAEQHDLDGLVAAVVAAAQR